jgi:hypothetical protein
MMENILIRAVTPARGTQYQHTCDKDVFESVAHAIDDLNGASFTYEEIRQKIEAPFTQVAVAVAFLRERGCIAPAQRRRSVAATNDVYLDAMIEFHALAEEKPG